VDLESGKISSLPYAEQLFSPRWSPDGRYIAALTDDSLKLMLFDVAARRWQELASMAIGYPSWSHDGQYIYFDTTLSEDAAFFRVRISDHKLERLFSLKALRRYWGPFGPWTGLGPDDLRYWSATSAARKSTHSIGRRHEHQRLDRILANRFGVQSCSLTVLSRLACWTSGKSPEARGRRELDFLLDARADVL